jgi:hypothetical protein
MMRYFYLVLAVVGGPAVASDVRQCVFTDQQFVSQLAVAEDWATFYALYKSSVPTCPDDGFYAEGYSDRVVHLLATRWSELAAFRRLIQSDEGFRDFVYRHVDATADTNDLTQLLINARSKCPVGAERVCVDLVRHAKVAIAGQS